MTYQEKENMDPSFENLLEYLKNARNFDFTGYKRSSVRRRIEGRMREVKIDNFDRYIEYLEVHTEEFIILFNTILINVTSFFRDEQAWGYLAESVLPQIVSQKRKNSQIRCWSAACASGQEAYSLAMLLAEAIGIDKFKDMVKIYATDIDEEALNYARQAKYTPKEVEGVPKHLLEKYFDNSGGNYAFRNDLRRLVIFGRHDLLQDAPISRLDLLICRNTLMYFNAETQDKILSRFHFALGERAYLFLGKAEMLLTRSNLFTPVDLKYRIFSKSPKSRLQEQMLIPERAHENNQVSAEHVTFQEDVFDNIAIPQVAVDLNGILILANRQARTNFGLKNEDLNRPFRDLEISYRPVELRSVIEQVIAKSVPVRIADVEMKKTSDQQASYLDVHVVPVVRSGGVLMGVTISFVDATSFHLLQEQTNNMKHDLETTNEELHSTNEELETTNEELQSTVEELQTTNEELQSTNEEMETMNEELQATNEELHTTNEELNQRTDELNLSNAFQLSILKGLRSAVIVMDKKFLITAWNHKAEELWGIRSAEVIGQSFFNLEIGLSVEELRPMIRSVIASQDEYKETTIETFDRRGKKLKCHVMATPLLGVREAVQGVILLIEKLEEIQNIKKRIRINK